MLRKKLENKAGAFFHSTAHIKYISARLPEKDPQTKCLMRKIWWNYKLKATDIEKLE